MDFKRVFGVLSLGLLLTQPVAAQSWYAPSFTSPEGRNTLGVYVIEPEASDFGVVGLWQRSSATTTIGVRAGVFAFDDAAFSVGADVARDLAGLSAALPVDVAGTLGVGATIKSGTFGWIPVGVTVGRTFEAGGWSFVPYVHPRAALELNVDGGDTDLDLGWQTGFGADVYSGRGIALRLGATLGDHSAVGLGLALTGPRLPGIASR